MRSHFDCRFFPYSTRWLLAVGIGILFCFQFQFDRALLAQVQEEKDAFRIHFQEAWHLETGEARLEEALSLYQRLIVTANLSRENRARCAIGAARCLLKLGRTEESTTAYQGVVAEYADVEDVAGEARRALEDREKAASGFSKRVRSLVKLLADDAQREMAKTMLREIGPSTAPFLMEAFVLRDSFAGRFAVEILAFFAGDNEQVLETLIEAIRDGDDLMVSQLGNALYQNQPFSDLLRMGEHPSTRVRLTAVQALKHRGQLDPSSIHPLIRLTKDSDPRVRAAAVAALIVFPRNTALLFDPVAAALKDEDPSVRRTAVAAAEWVGEYAQWNSGDPGWGMLQALVDLVGDSVPEVEADAVRALGLLRSSAEQSLIPDGARGERVLQRLIEIAGDVERDDRESAVVVLGPSRRAEAYDVFAKALNDLDVSLAKKAMAALGRLKDPRGAIALLSFLKEPRDIRSKARAIEVLWSQFPDLETRRRLVLSLPHFPERSVQWLCERIKENKQRVLARVALGIEAELGTKARISLLDVIRELRLQEGAPMVVRNLGDSNVELYAAYTAQVITTSEAVPGLISLLQSQNNNVRAAAAKALAAIGDRRAIEALVDLLLSPLDSVVGSAIQGLNAFKDSRAVFEEVLRRCDGISNDAAFELVIDLVRGNKRSDGWQDLFVATFDTTLLSRFPEHLLGDAAVLLGNTQRAEALLALRGLAAHSSRVIRGNAVRALGQLPHAVAIPDLVRALDDENLRVQIDAINGLVGLNTEDPRIVRPLADKMKDFDRFENWLIVRALQRFGNPEVLPEILDMLKKGNISKERTDPRKAALWSFLSYPKEDALRALETVIGGDFSPEVKKIAVTVLARIDHPFARSIVISLLANKESAVRGEAVRALGRTLDPSSLPQLVSLLRDPLDEIRQAASDAIEQIRYYLDQVSYSRAGHADGSLEARARDELLAMLQDAQASVRLRAVQSLVRMNDRGALPHLVSLRRDPDVSVRNAVEEAMDQLAVPPAKEK